MNGLVQYQSRNGNWGLWHFVTESSDIQLPCWLKYGIGFMSTSDELSISESE